MSEKVKKKNSGRSATLFDWLRWLGAFAAIAGAALLVVGSHYISDLKICEYSPNMPSHEKCEPFPIEAAIPLFILALALMWKDLSEFSIYGLGRVVRRIDDSQQKLQEGQAALQGQLSMIQSQTLNNNLYFGLEDEVERVRKREPNLAAEAEETPTAWSDLESAWEKLEPWSQLAKRLRDQYFCEALGAAKFDPVALKANLSVADRDLLSATGLTPDTDLRKVEAWASAAHPRLELVRKVIRAGPTLPELQIKQALAVARDLWNELKEEELVPNV